MSLEFTQQLVDRSILTADTSVSSPLVAKSSKPSRYRYKKQKKPEKHIDQKNTSISIDNQISDVVPVSSSSLNVDAKPFIPPNADIRSVKMPPSKLNKKRNVKSNNNSNIQKEKVEVESFCCLICANSREYCAIGVCDHIVCSECSLRMRFKSQDFSCAICKKELNTVIVLLNIELVPFSSFDINELEFDCYPGFDADVLTKMLFFKCNNHFRLMQDKRSPICPMKDCKQRFQSIHLLIAHMKNSKDSMHKSLQFCSLCVEHRPLFIDEQELYNEKDLKSHFKSKVGNTDSHVICEFCNDYYFDNAHLMRHMRDKHITCHLCPQEFDHRYYINQDSLEYHISENHMVCYKCEKLGLLAAFNSHTAYRDHMYDVHSDIININDIFLINRKPLRSVPTSRHRMNYIDMRRNQVHVNHSNTFEILESDNGLRNSNQSLSRIQAQLVTSTNIPVNMQIAGRVTGSGRFARDSSDENMQQYIDESRRKSNWSASLKNSTNLKSSFPSLQQVVSKSSTTPSKKQQISSELHPMSMVATLQKLEADRYKEQLLQQQRVQEAALRRRLRNDALAEAMGIPTFGSLIKAADLRSTSDADEIKLYDLLRTPLYPGTMLNWSKENFKLLEQIERKLAEMLASDTINSFQTKPLSYSNRQVIHALARIYGLNSFEFDYEPNRYVSLVKRPDSCVPTIVLSSACKMRNLYIPLAIYSSNDPQSTQLFNNDGVPPVLYFSSYNASIDEYSSTTVPSLYSKTTKENTSKDPSLLVVEVLRLLVTDIRSFKSIDANNSVENMGIVEIKMSGPSMVSVIFESILHAISAFHSLKNEKSEFVTQGYNTVYEIQSLIQFPKITEHSDTKEMTLVNAWDDEDNVNISYQSIPLKNPPKPNVTTAITTFKVDINNDWETDIETLNLIDIKENSVSDAFYNLNQHFIEKENARRNGYSILDDDINEEMLEESESMKSEMYNSNRAESANTAPVGTIELECVKCLQMNVISLSHLNDKSDISCSNCNENII